jgi:hypothetical protein
MIRIYEATSARRSCFNSLSPLRQMLSRQGRRAPDEVIFHHDESMASGNGQFCADHEWEDAICANLNRLPKVHGDVGSRPEPALALVIRPNRQTQSIPRLAIPESLNDRHKSCGVSARPGPGCCQPDEATAGSPAIHRRCFQPGIGVLMIQQTPIRPQAPSVLTGGAAESRRKAAASRRRRLLHSLEKQALFY